MLARTIKSKRKEFSHQAKFTYRVFMLAQVTKVITVAIRTSQKPITITP